MGGGTSRRRVVEEDLGGCVAVVTGASSGLGRAVAFRLAVMGAHTILACRDRSRTDEVIERMREQLTAKDGARGELEYMHLDLSSLQSVKEFADNFKRKNLPLHILVNNAAVAFVPFERTKKDGFECHYQVNYLGHFLLTLELLPCLRKVEAGQANVVILSSAAHTAGKLDLSNMNGEDHYSRYTFYANSKMYNVMFAFSLQRRVREQRINVCCVDPGKVRSNLFHEATKGSRLLRGVAYTVTHLPFLYQLPEAAASVVLNCAVNHDLDTRTAHYFKGWRERESSQLSRSIEQQRQLWEMSVIAVQEYLSEQTRKQYLTFTAEDEKRDEEGKRVEEESDATEGVEGRRGERDGEPGETSGTAAHIMGLTTNV